MTGLFTSCGLIPAIFITLAWQQRWFQTSVPLTRSYQHQQPPNGTIGLVCVNAATGAILFNRTLATFLEQRCQPDGSSDITMAIISPGGPLHILASSAVYVVDSTTLSIELKCNFVSATSASCGRSEWRWKSRINIWTMYFSRWSLR